MPSISSIALFSLVALGAVAAPAERRHWGNGKCISDAEADQVASAWASLIVEFSADLTDAVTTENLTDYSESVNTLINSCPQGDAAKPLPLLAPTFSSREEFKIGQGQQPSINFERLNLWHSCDTVIFRWKTTNTAPIPEPKPVVGIISLEVVKNTNGGEYPWLIDTVYSEFDSGAWLQNLVEAGICTSGAGLPSGSNSTCSDAASSSTIVSPASSTWASSSTWAASSATSTWAPSSASSWVESSSTWAPSSTWTPSSSASWAAETTDCEEDETTTAWATQTAYASTTTWA